MEPLPWRPAYVVVPEQLTGFVGARCARIARVHHVWQGTVDRSSGPLELSWSDGRVLLLDTRADWTLEVSTEAWVDPYAGIDGDHRDEVAREVGLFVKEDAAPGTPLGDLSGQTLNGIEGIFSKVNELMGVILDFGTARVRAAQSEGDLTFVVT